MRRYKSPSARTSGAASVRPRRRAGAGKLWLYGAHAVAAALENPSRKIERLVLTPEALLRQGKDMASAAAKRKIPPETMKSTALATLLPTGAVHQGIAAVAKPLASPQLDEACSVSQDERSLVVVLDQVTDPRNLGAVLRSAAAFGARAVVVQDRNTPQETGILAKAASGGLDRVPLVRAVNLARALEGLAELGYWRIALDSGAKTPLDNACTDSAVALVLGAEGKGLRRLTIEHCDAAARLPVVSGRSTSLNVSVAAAIALYEFVRQRDMHAPGKWGA